MIRWLAIVALAAFVGQPGVCNAQSSNSNLDNVPPTSTSYKTFILGSSVDEIARDISSLNLDTYCPGTTVCKEVERAKDDGMVKARLGEEVHFIVEADRDGAVAMYFRAGKLVQVVVILPPSVSFSDAVSGLTNKFGKPKAQSTEVFGNALGGRFDCGRARWVIQADGGIVSAMETIKFDEGIVRTVGLTFESEEQYARDLRGHQDSLPKF